MGWDIDSFEPVNLIEHIEQGYYGYDDEWRVVSNYTPDDTRLAFSMYHSLIVSIVKLVWLNVAMYHVLLMRLKVTVFVDDENVVNTSQDVHDLMSAIADLLEGRLAAEKAECGEKLSAMQIPLGQQNIDSRFLPMPDPIVFVKARKHKRKGRQCPPREKSVKINENQYVPIHSTQINENEGNSKIVECVEIESRINVVAESNIDEKSSNINANQEMIDGDVLNTKANDAIELKKNEITGNLSNISENTANNIDEISDGEPWSNAFELSTRTNVNIDESRLNVDTNCSIEENVSSTNV